MSARARTLPCPRCREPPSTSTFPAAAAPPSRSPSPSPRRVPVELTATVSGVVAGETDAEQRCADRDGRDHADSSHELGTARVHSLRGYGAQFNHHLYAPITGRCRREYPDVEPKVKQLQPELVRIFYNDNWEENPDRPTRSGRELRVVRESRAARAGDGGDDRHQAIRTSATSRASHPPSYDDPVRGRPRRTSFRTTGSRTFAGSRSANEPNSRALSRSSSTRRSTRRSKPARCARPGRSDPHHGRWLVENGGTRVATTSG